MNNKIIQSLFNWYNEIGITECISNNQWDRTFLKEDDVKKSISRKLDKSNELKKLKISLENIKGNELKDQSTQIVFSDGNFNSKIMLVGEAPGVEEDRIGKPFVGLSGKLLDKILESINLNRNESIYITNVVPWRPEGNRQPNTQEISLFKPFLEKHIAIVNPLILILLGRVAMEAIIQESFNDKISKIRGQWKEYKNPYLKDIIPTLATFHPAYLLRSPGKKAIVWQDFINIKKKIQELGLY